MKKISLLLTCGLFIACNTKNEESKLETSTDSVTTTVEKTVEKESYSNELTLNNITFKISVIGNQLTITPNGLTEDNSVISRTIDGNVTKAEIGDINSDSSPELFIYTSSGGNENIGKAYGFSVNNGKSVSDISIPSLSENKDAYSGYNGNDEFSIVENSLIQRFPLTNNSKSKYKQIQYKLVDGEASRKLVVHKISEF